MCKKSMCVCVNNEKPPLGGVEQTADPFFGENNFKERGGKRFVFDSLERKTKAVDSTRVGICRNCQTSIYTGEKVKLRKWVCVKTSFKI